MPLLTRLAEEGSGLLVPASPARPTTVSSDRSISSICSGSRQLRHPPSYLSRYCPIADLFVQVLAQLSARAAQRFLSFPSIGSPLPCLIHLNSRRYGQNRSAAQRARASRPVWHSSCSHLRLSAQDTSDTLFKEITMADTRDKVKDKIDEAAAKAKEATDQASDKAQDTARAAGDKIKETGQKIKDKGE
jgi:hypothetical protein